MRRRVPIVLAGLLLVTLVACTGDDDGGDAPPAAEELPELAATWTATLPDATTLATDLERRGRLTAFPVDDDLVVVGTTAVTGLDQDGEQLWSWSVPAELGEICLAAPPGDGGVAALAFKADDRCDTLGGLDVVDGTLLWDQDLGPLGPQFEPVELWAGAQSIVAAGGCIRSRLFDLRTGEPGRVLAKPSSFRVCDVQMRLRDGLGAIYARSRGGEPSLSVVDLETGEALWQRPEGYGSSLKGFVSTDPLILDFSDENRRTLRAYDAQGEPGAYLGPEVSRDTGASFAGVQDGVLVGTYQLDQDRPTAGPYVGTDVVTGERRWRAGPDQTWILGGTDDALIALGGAGAGTVDDIGQRTGVDADGFVTLGLAAYDDPTQTVGLGRVQVGAETSDGAAGLGWAGGWLLRQRDDELSAYALPARDTWSDLPALPPAPDPGWRSEDVRPADAADLCAALTPETLAALAVRQGELPLPATCHLFSTDVRLFVDAVAVPPAGDRTAVQEAEDETDFQAEYVLPQDVDPEPLDELGDLADEAWIAAEPSDIGEVEFTILARYRNVVVSVNAYDRGGLGPSVDADARREASIQAAREVLTELADRAP